MSRSPPPPATQRAASGDEPDSSPALFFARIGRWLPLRLLCYGLGFLAASVAVKVLTATLVPPPPSPLHDILAVIRNLVLTVAAVAVYALLVRLLERRPASEVGPRRALATFLVGTAIGIGLMSTVYLILWRIGVAHFSGGTGLDDLALGLFRPAVTALLEELLFRVMLFRILEEITGTTLAVLLSAAIFGALHGANPGATPFDIATLSLELGVLFALAYVLTRNIWLAAGIHMGWNFAQGYGFGAQVSGLAQSHSILRASLTGPDILTGGSFGPEGSVVALGVGLAAAAVLLVLIARKSDWRSLHFRLRVGR